LVAVYGCKSTINAVTVFIFVTQFFQLQPGGFRRPLTMGYQTSETQEQFRAQPGISEPTITPNVRGYLLHGHDTSGPSQVCPW
jgi:hypothetical protein